MEIGKPKIDYLTLSSDVRKSHMSFKLMVPGYPDESNWLGYHGWSSGEVFVGSRVDAKGNESYLLNASGERAHEVAGHMRNIGVAAKATRVDVQITMPLPEGYKSRKLCDSLRSGVFRRPGPPSSILLIDGGGMDTVYIGSKTSTRRIRVYVKEGMDGSLFLRFEVQYRSELAASTWRQFCERSEGVLGEILRGEIESLPEVQLWRMYTDVLGPGMWKPKHAADRPSNTEKWFYSQVVPPLERLLSDHDSGKRVARVLLALLEDSGWGDRGSESSRAAT